jgi:transposase
VGAWNCGVSNILKVNEQEAIRSLQQKGWSLRRIARELGLHRRTVSRYAEPDSKCASISTPGSEAAVSKCTSNSTPGSQGLTGAQREPALGSVGRKSHCEPLSEGIRARLEAGLSSQRIYQDLVAENGFCGSYQSVKRFVRKLQAAQPERVWRMECQPGEEMQVDFGLGAPIDSGEGKARRSWVLRAVLSYSRKGYSEAVLRQDTETFLRCVENALRHFGGVPTLLNLDNLKAAVLQADWFDPEINPKTADFCRHYGMHVMPCRPRTPEHKGKVERGVAYVRGNALKGRRFKSLAEENLFLAHWECSVADKRIHGTTCKQVAACFEEERPHLQDLPAALFACYQEARRKVGRDSFVEVQKAYYEAPPEYIGRQVWVRWDSRTLRIFNERFEQVQIHTRLEAGKFSRILGAQGMSRPVLKSCRWWVERAAMLGEHCGRWAQSALETRGPEALRSLIGLCDLSKKHTASALNTACAKALAAGTRRLRDVRQLLHKEAGEQTRFAFAEDHPLIRNLSAYAEFISNQTPSSHRENPIDHDQPKPQTKCPDPATLGAA